MAAPTPTLMGIPAELRLRIFDEVFYSTRVWIERGPERLTEDDADDYESVEDAKANGVTYFKRGLSVLPRTPKAITSLMLVCRTFASEVSNDWHSKVTYTFESTVSFIDILSQWPQEKVLSLRYVDVEDTPLPLYPYDSTYAYHTHTFVDCLPMFPGLKLELLTVVNIWLFADGSTWDGWCDMAYVGAMNALVRSQGWRRLHYRSGILGLKPSEQREIEAKLQGIRDANNEPDLTYSWGRNRPKNSNRYALGYPKEDVPEDMRQDVEEVRKWYEDHPEEREDVPPEADGLHVALAVTRGRGARYAQPGRELESEVLRGLMEKMSWVDVRKVDDYLVSDGVDNPDHHL